MALQDKYKINGFVDTNNPVWTNIERIAAACSAWPTFDSHTGKFSLVINEVTPSTFTFDESNILSEITFATSETSEVYNEGEIKFANQDQFGKFDSLSQRLLPPGEPNYDISPDEYPNKLSLQNEFINDSVQADAVLRTELKQSRRDRIITFNSDYTAIGVQAGDVVTVTVSEKDLNLRNQKYRIIEVEETDGELGEIVLQFTAVDYYDETYDFDLLIRTNESVASPVPPIKSNEAVEENKTQAFGEKLGQAIQDPAIRGQFTSNVTIQADFPAAIPMFGTLTLNHSSAYNYFVYNGSTADYNGDNPYATDIANITNSTNATITFTDTIVIIQDQFLRTTFSNVGGMTTLNDPNIDWYIYYPSGQSNVFIMFGEVDPADGIYKYYYWNSTSAPAYTSGGTLSFRSYGQFAFSVNVPIKTMNLTWESPQAEYFYTVDGTEKRITSAIPSIVYLYRGALDENGFAYPVGDPIRIKYSEWSSYSTTINLGNDPGGVFIVRYFGLNTYDLNATNNFISQDSIKIIQSQSGVVLNIQAFLQ